MAVDIEPGTENRTPGESSYFSDFFNKESNKKLIHKMRFCLSELRFGHSGLVMAIFNLIESNACSSVSFTRASCTVELKRDEEGPLMISIRRVFEIGYEVLENFLGEEAYAPDDFRKQQALKELLDFLSGGK